MGEIKKWAARRPPISFLSSMKTQQTLPPNNEFKKYKTIVEKSPDIIFTIDYPGLKFTFLNRAFEQVTGFEIKDWLGKSFSSLVYREDVSLAGQKLEQSLTASKPKNFWLRVKAIKKPFLFLEFQLIPQKTLGKIKEGIGVARDITIRKEWESSLKFQRSLLKAQSEASIDGILVVSKEKEIILYNHHFLEIWQINERALSSRSEELATKYLAPKLLNPDEFLSIIQSTYRQPAEKTYDEVKLKDGRTLGRYCAPLTSSDGSNFGHISFYRDVTEQKEDAKRKDDFVAIASHELKTPITSLKAFTQILLERQKKTRDASLEFFLSRMSSQINNLTELVTDLLDVARIRTGKMELNYDQIKISDFLKETIELSVHPSLRPWIKLDVEGNPTVKADEQRLRQVLMNLLSNAQKYSKRNPKIIVRAGSVGKEVIVFVKDCGIGIEAGKLKKIFEPFSQFRKIDSENMPSLGLGLYISAQIIKMHGGRIWAESRLNRGSTFYFTLPKTKT